MTSFCEIYPYLARLETIIVSQQQIITSMQQMQMQMWAYLQEKPVDLEKRATLPGAKDPNSD